MLLELVLGFESRRGDISNVSAKKKKMVRRGGEEPAIYVNSDLSDDMEGER